VLTLWLLNYDRDQRIRIIQIESTEALNSQTLKALIKESLREILREERLNLCKLLMPFVSDEEQAEIEVQFGSPKDFDVSETVDLTDWVKHGGRNDSF
jgi:hypothetical protein